MTFEHHQIRQVFITPYTLSAYLSSFLTYMGHGVRDVMQVYCRPDNPDNVDRMYSDYIFATMKYTIVALSSIH